MGSTLTTRRRPLATDRADHVLALVAFLVLCAIINYIRALGVLQPLGNTLHAAFRRRTTARTQDTFTGPANPKYEPLSSSPPPRPPLRTFLVTIPLLGSKHGADVASVMIERTAIRTWLEQPRPPGYDVLVLGVVESQEHCDTTIQSLRGYECQSLPPHCLDFTYHIMTMDCVLTAAYEKSKKEQFDFVVLTNGDVFFSPTIFEASHYAALHYPQGFVVVGQRVDINMSVSQGSSPMDVVSEAVDLAFTSGRRHQTLGVDFFILPPSILPTSFPPYLVGRWRWDNALLYHFLHSQVPVLDATPAIMAIHLGVNNYSSASHLERVGASYNDELASKTLGHAHSLGRIDNTPLILEAIEPTEDAGHRTPPFLITPRENPFHVLEMAVLHSSSRGPDPSIVLVPVFPGQVVQALNWGCWAQAAGYPHYIFLPYDCVTHTSLIHHGASSIYLQAEVEALPPWPKTTATDHSRAVPLPYRQLQLEVMDHLVNKQNLTVFTTDTNILWMQSPLSLLSNDSHHCDAIVMTNAQGRIPGLPGTLLAVQPTVQGQVFMTGLVECMLYGRDRKKSTRNAGRRLDADKSTEPDPLDTGQQTGEEGGEEEDPQTLHLLEEECVLELQKLLPDLQLCRRPEQDYFQPYEVDSHGDDRVAFRLGTAEQQPVTQLEAALMRWDKKIRSCSTNGDYPGP